jgi:hypothetical protein
MAKRMGKKGTLCGPNNDHWVKAMNDELDQIEKNNTWEMVHRPEGKNIIGSKWIFKNKLNE